MKFLGIFIALCVGCSTHTYAKQDGSALHQVKPIELRIISRDEKGVTQREYFQCTPKTCCFSENFYCFMEKGHCVCDLYVCGQAATKGNKTYWLKIVGTDAEKYCGRPRLLHELTNLCLCDPDKAIPCNGCNPPVGGCGANSMVRTLPLDCDPS